MSDTSIASVGSPPTSAIDVTSGAYQEPATTGVTLDTCLVPSAYIISCTSVEDCSAQSLVVQLWTCWALCSAMS
jgi:hypothetical protein